MQFLRASAALLSAVCACGPTAKPEAPAREPAAAPAPVVLLEYVANEKVGELPLTRELSANDPLRRELEPILARPYIRWVLALGAEAKKVGAIEHPTFFVLMKGGNRPKYGLAVAGASGVKRYPKAWYVEIDPKEAGLLIPHEYGHTLMFGLLPDDVPPHPSTLPHTTSAITNDVTAFSEGWGIHFETLAGDRRETGAVYRQRHRDEFPLEGKWGDSLLPAKDVITYAQSYRRYNCIKENCFAFLPRVRQRFFEVDTPTSDDLVARWTDATYDPAALRSLPQMVASEGVIASLFYRLATAPEPGGAPGVAGDPPLPDVSRYRAIFAAFATLKEERLVRVPTVLAFLTSLLEAADEPERKRIAKIFLEVFHYTPVFDDAQEFYRRLHAHGHLMNRDAVLAELDERRPRMDGAVKAIAAEPARLVGREVPELWVANRGALVTMSILGIVDRPLVFDINTAPVEFLMSVPGIGLKEAQALVEARDARGGFATIGDLPAEVRSAFEPLLRALSEQDN